MHLKRIFTIITILLLPSILMSEDVHKIEGFSEDLIERIVPDAEKNILKVKKPDVSSKNVPLVNKDNKNKKTTTPEISIIETDEDLSGQKIIWIGGIVNGIKKDHFKESMDIVSNILIKHDLDAGKFYIMAKPSDIDHSLYSKLVARNGEISFPFIMPEAYPVSSSPTWIVQTEKGQILIEGEINLDRFVNSEGEFLDEPKKLKAPEKEEPQGGLEKF